MHNRKSLLIVPPDPTIFSDASKKGWSASCHEITTGGLWSSLEKFWHINALELKAVRLAILSFTQFKKLNTIHLRIKNMIALSYLLNMGGTQNKPLIEISKEISSYCIERKIHLTAEYTFDSSLSNQTADWASQNFQDSSELPHWFQTNLQLFSETIIGPVCFQSLPPTAIIHIAWQREPQNVATDAFQQDWEY